MSRSSIMRLRALALVVGLILAGCAPPPPSADLPFATDLGDAPASVVQAVTDAQKLLEPHNLNPANVAQLGRVLHANGFHAEARQCWAWLTTAQPAVAEWVYLLSDLDQATNRRADRVRRLARVTELDPTYAPAWLRRAELVLKSGYPAEAAIFLHQRLELLPTDSYARMGLVRIDLAQNQIARATGRLEAILRDDPHFSPAHNLYAELLAERGDETGARRHRWIGRETGRYREPADPWLEAVAAACADPARLELMARVAAQLGDTARARRLMERAFSLGEAAPWYRESLGKLYREQGDITQARTTLNGGTDADRTLGSWVELIQITRSTNDIETTLEWLDRGMSIHPDAFELWNELAQTFAAVGRPREAMGAYRKALDLDPFDAATNFNLAATLIGEERFGEAIVCLQNSLTSQPSFANSLKLLARLELDSGRPDDATPYVQRLHEAHPGDPDACDLMADWHLAYHRRDAARKVMDEGLHLAQWSQNPSAIQYFKKARQELD